MTRARPLIDRLEEKLKAMPNGCWEWQGCRTRQGYGRIGRGMRGGGTTSTHRAMWEIVFGLIPDGLCVLHNCDNPPCANPAHLFLGTNLDNTRDMITKGRQYYPTGEEASPAVLTWSQVRAIRSDSRTYAQIAEEYGIGMTTVGHIKRRETWKEQ